MGKLDLHIAARKEFEVVEFLLLEWVGASGLASLLISLSEGNARLLCLLPSPWESSSFLKMNVALVILTLVSMSKIKSMMSQASILLCMRIMFSRFSFVSFFLLLLICCLRKYSFN